MNLVSTDTDSIRQAALELMVESLLQEENDQRLGSLLATDVDEETIGKVMPARTVAAGFYDFANYLIWLRGMIECDVDLVIYADEADGLQAIAAARQEFERAHPACPRCSIRQYSTSPMFCRNKACRMDFRKKN